MAVQKWCTNEAVLARAPEFLNDSELGELDSPTLPRVIEDATQQVQHILQSRYDITQFFDLPLTGVGALARSIQDFTADIAAWLLVQREQRGTSNGKLEDYLKKLIHAWKTRVTQGALFDDFGVLFDTINGPEAAPYDIEGPSVFGKIYTAGGDSDRYGVPNYDVRTDVSETRRLDRRV